MSRGRARASVFLLAAAFGAGRASALVIALDPETMARPAGEAGGAGRPSPTPVPTPSGPVDRSVTAVATASKTEVAVGERFSVDVKVTAPSGTSFSFPPEILTEAAELRPAAREAGGEGTPAAPPPGAHRYTAAVFALSDAKIPPVTVKYRLPGGGEGEVATEPIALTVVSRLPKDADPEKIADVRGPQALSIGRAFWVALGLVGLGLAAFALWLVRRRRRSQTAPVPAPPPVDPAAEAREALAALVASGHLAGGDHRGFYIALTAIAKRYLERRLGAPVLEMTTAETVAFLRDSRSASGLVGPMRDLAGAADQIKFARGAGLTAEAERHTDAVRGMIATLEAALQPPPPAASEKVA